MKDINGFILFIENRLTFQQNKEINLQFVINWEDIPSSNNNQFSFMENLCSWINFHYPNLKASYDVFSRIYNVSRENIEKKILYQLD